MNNDIKIEDKIEDWLKEQGYPLEMKIASILHKKGFHVVQSDYYTDPESGDSREIDIVANHIKIVKVNGFEIVFRFIIVIECKQTKKKPWLLFTSEMKYLINPVLQRLTNQFGKRYLNEISNKDNIQNLSFFSLPNRRAYGITQALTSGKDNAYSAVVSVSKAALANIIELDENRKKLESNNIVFSIPSELCSIVLPIVVIDGLLFDAFLDDQYDMKIKDVERGLLLWRNPITGDQHSIINVVTSSSFELFISELLESIKKFYSLSEENYSEQLLKAIKNIRGSK